MHKTGPERGLSHFWQKLGSIKTNMMGPVHKLSYAYVVPHKQTLDEEGLHAHLNRNSAKDHVLLAEK